MFFLSYGVSEAYASSRTKGLSNYKIVMVCLQSVNRKVYFKNLYQIINPIDICTLKTITSL